jgi:hypothetical protein
LWAGVVGLLPDPEEEAYELTGGWVVGLDGKCDADNIAD